MLQNQRQGYILLSERISTMADEDLAKEQPSPDANTSVDPLSGQVPVSKNKEDELLKSVGEGLSDEDAAPVASATVKKKRSPKKILILLLVVIILAGVALSLRMFVFKQKAVAPDQSGNATTQNTQKQELTYEPDSVVYAFRAKDGDPYSIYLRPAAGGDRVEAAKLERDEVVLGGDTVGQKALFYTDSKVYLSENGGKKFEPVLTVGAGEQITSAKLSTESEFFVAAIFTGADGVVNKYGLDGKNKTEVLKTSNTAPTVYGFGSDKLVYSEGCYNCDGPRTAYKIYDQKAKASKDFLDTAKPENILEVRVDRLLSAISYVAATPSSAADDVGIGPGVSPYKVSVYNVKDGKTTQVTTIGTAGEKNPNGTTKYRQIFIGFLAGTSTPYYAEGTDLSKVENNKSSPYYQSTKTLLTVPYVGKSSVIVGTGADSSDYALSNYGFSDKKDTPIFSGDNNTIIIGVTTK